jgi:hypothetical protein
MAFDIAYHEAYQRAGNVALLCEGDVIGYETSILGRWATEKLGSNPLVDVWPCGTKTAIFGMSDAVGRARPIVVIEDRDFRTPAEGESECGSQSKTRNNRGVRVIDWRCWRRNEIENYLLEPSLVLDLMSELFGCASDDVRAGLEEIIASQVIYQAAMHVLYRSRHGWNKTDPAPRLPNNLKYHPRWDDNSLTPVSPTKDQVRNTLAANARDWFERFVSQDGSKTPIQPEELVQEFENKCAEWASASWDHRVWLIDWSGKEILKWLRVLMTARFGWYDPDSQRRIKLKWQDLKRAEFDEQDRAVEGALRPELVHGFVAYLVSATEGDIPNEWSEIEGVLRAWTP